jgi:hypothetical protein
VILEVGVRLGVLEQGRAYNKSCQLQDIKCWTILSSLEFKYKLEYNIIHKASRPLGQWVEGYTTEV